MPATTEPSSRLLGRVRDEMHPRCVVCGRPSPDGLGLEFHLRDDDAVTARFDCGREYEGYGGMLHGGVTSAVADGAMTNCLFAHGIAAVTAELRVRFRHPIRLGAPLTVTARITRRCRPLFLVEAELEQEGKLKAEAAGKFMEKPEGPTP